MQGSWKGRMLCEKELGRNMSEEMMLGCYELDAVWGGWEKGCGERKKRGYLRKYVCLRDVGGKKDVWSR